MSANMASTLVRSLLLAILIGASSSYGIGYTYPRASIYLHVNDTLKITCVLNTTTIDENSSHLNFYVNNTKEEDRRYVKVLNSSAIQLVIPNMNASTRSYSCKMKKGRIYHGIDLNDVFVGYPPAPVRNFKCRSPNWQNMSCTFEKPYNPVHVTYTLRFHVPDDRRIYSCKLTDNECIVTPHSVGGIYRPGLAKYYYTLSSHNELGDSTEDFEIDHFAIVVPDPPFSASVGEITPISARLSWQRPDALQMFVNLLEYSVRYTSKYDNGVWKDLATFEESIPNEKTKFTWSSLPFPHVFYNVEIRSKVVTAENIPEMWSKATNISFWSGSRIPDHPPLTPPGSFSVDDNDNVYVYWKELEEHNQNGAEFTYQVKCTSHPKYDTPSVTTNFKKKYNAMAANVHETLHFTVRSSNEMGPSKNASHIVVPSKANRCNPPREIRSILHNKDGPNRKYVFSWHTPAKDSIHNITSYTVFWCKAGIEYLSPCNSSIDFKQLNSNETSFELFTEDSLSFAVSANSEESSSGMFWVKCTALADNEFSKVQSQIMKVESKWASVEWNTHCIDQSLSHGYQITYCQVRSDRNNSNCTDDTLQTINVTGAAIHNFTITDLVPYHTYKVNIAAQSDLLTGPSSDPVFFTTLEAAPSPPQSLRVLDVSSESFTLEWEAPANINGVLNRYTVFYNNSKVEVPKQGNSTNRMTYVLSNLAAHSMYQISVVACTGVQPCSNTSNMVSPITDIGKPGIVQLRNNSGGVIRWDPPMIAGGDLNYYEMEVNQSSDPHPIIIYLNGTTCTMSIDPCLSSRSVKWSLKVRAVNLRYSPHGVERTKPADENVDRSSGLSNLQKRHSSIDNYANTRNQLLHEKVNQPIIPHPESHHAPFCLEQISHIHYSSEHVTHFRGNWLDVHSDGCSVKTIDFPLLIGIMFLALIIAMFLSVQFMWKKLERMRNIEIEFPNVLKNKLADSTSGTGGIVVGTLDIGRKSDGSYKIGEQEVGLLPSYHHGVDEEGESVGDSDPIEATENEMRSPSNGGDMINDFLRQSPIYPVQSMGQSPSSDYSPKFEFINQTSPVVMPVKTSSPIPYQMAPRPMSTFSPTPSTMHDSVPMRSPMVNANGYVPNDIVPIGIVRSGYLPQDEAFAVRTSLVPSPAGTPDETRAKVSVDGISGYVTHKQLSDFGQMIH